MLEKKTKSIWFIISLTILLILVLVYLFSGNALRKVLPGIDAIPGSTVLFLESKGINDLTGKINSDNQIWNNLANIPEFVSFNQHLKRFDSISGKNKFFETINNLKFYLAVKAVEKELLSLLIVELPEINTKNDVVDFLENLTGKKSNKPERSISGSIFYSIPCNDGSTYYWFYKKGLFFGAYDTGYLQEALEQVNSKKSVSQQEAFRQVAKTAGKNVDANLYIKMDALDGVFNILLNENQHTGYPAINNSASWCELDIILKSHESLLNGYTSLTDSMGQYFESFTGQQPRKITITDVLPFNTVFFIWKGFDSFNNYYRQWLEYMKQNQMYEPYHKRYNQIRERYKINLAEELFGIIENELMWGSTGTDAATFKQNAFMAFTTNDPVRANQKLTSIMHKVSGSGIVETYHGHLIKKINLPDLIPDALGRQYAHITGFYFTIIKNYVIVANHTDLIREFINTSLSGKVLSENINYKEFSDNISETSNLFCYFNLRNACTVVENITQDRISQIIAKNNQILGNFHAFALQFSWVNQMFYTNAYLKYNPEYREENRAQWITTLDSKIVSKPFLVKDHTDKTYNIIVFDEDRNIYLIDSNGNILWKMQLGGKLQSSVFPVDFYKNKKIQYLFNTAQELYILDLLGRNVGNYPIKLNREVTNGLSLFDYNGNKEYRILFASNDNRINNYNISGSSVKGWLNPKTSNRVTGVIQHLENKNQDFIFIPVENGKLLITDRRGNPRINILGDFVKSDNALVYVNKTNSKADFLTTDHKGHLTYISANGKTDKTAFRDFSPSHFFIYDDFDKDGNNDFIFLDKNELYIYDRFKNLIFEYRFGNNIEIAPVVIPVSYKENLLAIVSKDDNRIYLFNNKGRQVFGTGMVGETPVSIGSLNNNSELNLIVGSGNTLYNYLLN